jgi:FkbM family methyltransferase
MKMKNLIHKLFRTTGYDFQRYYPDNFSTLKRSNLIISENIDLLLDVGANAGDYVLALRDSGYQGRVVSFEPLSKPFSILEKRSSRDSNWDCINVALGIAEEDGEIFLSEHSTSSSLLPINDTHLNALPSSAVISKEKIKISPLDSFLGTVVKLQDRVYLKIDVQGYEMFALQGAVQLLNQVRALEIELSFVPLYQGAPVFNEIVTYLENLGFMLISLNHVFSDPDTDRLLQVDGLFIRQPD